MSGYFRGETEPTLRKEDSVKASVNGININYEVSGTEGKPWITFSHALCNNLTLWDEQAELLKGDYRILRYDHRGLGQSDAPEGPYTFPMIIADALALLDHVGVEQTHWCGLSIGGTIRIISSTASMSRPKKAWKGWWSRRFRGGLRPNRWPPIFRSSTRSAA